MAVSEVERTQLATRLSEAVGKEAAETLMKCILPDGRDQLATKSDIEVLKGAMEALAREFRAENLETRSLVELKLARQARLHYGTLSAFLMSMWGMFLAQNFIV